MDVDPLPPDWVSFITSALKDCGKGALFSPAKFVAQLTAKGASLRQHVRVGDAYADLVLRTPWEVGLALQSVMPRRRTLQRLVDHFERPMIICRDSDFLPVPLKGCWVVGIGEAIVEGVGVVDPGDYQEADFTEEADQQLDLLREDGLTRGGLTALFNIVSAGDLIEQYADEYVELLVASPGDPELSFRIGKELFRAGLHDEALVPLAHTLWLKTDYRAGSPIDESPYFYIGHIEMAAGRYSSAALAFQQLVRRADSDAAAHALLGEALHRLGWHRGAVEQFLVAVERDPAYFDTDPARRRLWEESHNSLRWG